MLASNYFVFRARIRTRSTMWDNEGRVGMLRSAAKDSKRRTQKLAATSHHNGASHISHARPKAFSKVHLGHGWLRPSEQAKMSRCDRSCVVRQRLRRPPTASKVPLNPHCPPRVADMASLCPSREALRSLVPRVDGTSLARILKAATLALLSINSSLGKTAAGRWSECPAPP